MSLKGGPFSAVLSGSRDKVSVQGQEALLRQYTAPCLGISFQGSRHGCYPGRVQNDFSFAAHMDRQRLSTDRTIFNAPSTSE